MYFKVFLVGGIICVIGQIAMDFFKIVPAKVLVLFVTGGVILTAIGIYEPIVKFAQAGATVPLPGFGYVLAKSVIKEVDEVGLIGAFTGGLKGAAGGISSAIFFGYLVSIIFNPKAKE